LEVLPFFRRLGAPVIAVTGNPGSRLGKEADVTLDSGVKREADPLGLAPTTSTTVQLALGDALAGMVTEIRGLHADDFALFHPGGSLGRRLLLRVSDVMGAGERTPSVLLSASVREALFEITSKGYGATLVLGPKNGLKGIFTDGDLRRLLEERGVQGLDLTIEHVMTKSPRTIAPDRLAAEALKVMEDNEISCLAVTEGGALAGVVHLHELLKAGVA
ncbi:MAG: CBS domain-containing protein, partial [Synergistota bacterium]|nr:CBS domain-containing protein [Synergistota bacterium]